MKMDVIQLTLIWLLPVFLEGISDAEKHLGLMQGWSGRVEMLPADYLPMLVSWNL